MNRSRFSTVNNKSDYFIGRCRSTSNGTLCDGASTNKTMLKQFGVSGKRAGLKNYFTNPYDGNRNVYVFSDAPHIIKNIRNRLVQTKQLKSIITKYLFNSTKYIPMIIDFGIKNQRKTY